MFSPGARVVTLLAVAGILGCSPPPAFLDAGVEPDAGIADAGPADAGEPKCPPAEKLADGGCGALLTGWSAGPDLIQRRDHHFTFASGDFVYAGGGVIYDTMQLLQSIERARVGGDGSLGAWEDAGVLSARTAGSTVAQVGRIVVVAGGYRPGPRLSKDTEWAALSDDGAFVAWVAGPQLSVTRFHGASAAYGDSVYVAGGLTGNNTVNTEVVERSVVDPVTGPGAWQVVTPLPQPRSHHAMVQHGGALYVIGGLTGNPSGAYTDRLEVLRASIAADGTLGAWEVVSMLPAAVGTHAAFVFASRLYVAAGVQGTTTLDKVRRAELLDGGALGPWEDAPQLPFARAHLHHVAVAKGHAYLTGGSIGDRSQASTAIGRFE